MDGPGHTAIFFRLDSLIRSLAAPSLRTNCFTSPDERLSVLARMLEESSLCSDGRRRKRRKGRRKGGPIADRFAGAHLDHRPFNIRAASGAAGGLHSNITAGY